VLELFGDEALFAEGGKVRVISTTMQGFGGRDPFRVKSQRVRLLLPVLLLELNFLLHELFLGQRKG
jgi:hypothetical protein